MKKISLSLAVLFTLMLCSCGNKDSEKTMLDAMLAHHSITNGHVFTTTKGTEMVASDLVMENTEYEPKVVLTLYIGNTEPDTKIYDWCSMTIEERKADLKECGDMVIDYAKSEEWDNDYYLYVNIESIYDGESVTYDYEEDWLYVPNNENVFLSMYEEFDTMYKKNLEKSQEGIDFLINNDLAYLKHNEIEYKSSIFSGVYIYDGEFHNSIDNNEHTIY